MQDKWMKLFNQFQDSEYIPMDIQRIVMLYEMNKENDEKLKKLM